MVVYLDILLFLNFFVDFLLLLGTNRLGGYPPNKARAALAAAFGAVYGIATLIPGFSFLGNTLWRTVSLLIMGGIAFGFHRNALRRIFLFYLLSMALGGVAMGGSKGSFFGVLGAAAAVGFLCIFGFRGKIGKEFLPVELTCGNNKVTLTALCDTGNSLRDPITGQPVLIIGPAAAVRLTGLTAEELRDPVGTIGKLPGLCLVPYRAVGQKGGMLLALRLQNVRIGSWIGTQTVAFAPDGLGDNTEYQALTGGVL